MSKAAKKKRPSKSKKNEVLRGNVLSYNASVQSKYVKDMQALMREVIAETEKAVKGIYKSKPGKEFFTEDASIASQSRIALEALTKTIEKLLNRKSKGMAEKMVTNTDKASKSSLHNSLKELSGGLSIKTNVNSSGINEAFTSSVNANVDLIKSIPSEYLDQVKGIVNRSIQGGGFPDLKKEIESLLTDQASKTLNKAKNTALDQTRKAYTSITKARMEKVGVNKFEWLHSGGSREPRPHHKTKYPGGLNGGIFDINDPPVVDENTGQRGLPGDAINCKCTMRPVIEFDEGEPT